MRALGRLVGLLSLLAVFVTAGCAAGAPGAPPEPGQIAALAQEIERLGPGVDPEEADRAARVAYEETRRLAIAYQITDPPLIHNTKVNMGLKPRGLCWHWAEDMEKRLRQENFRTLTLHRAIANADNRYRIDHSTVIISRRGDTMFEGIVLDPWRKGGVLTWTPTRDDDEYVWVPREEVFAEKLRSTGETWPVAHLTGLRR